jgi:hypothetical protein
MALPAGGSLGSSFTLGIGGGLSCGLSSSKIVVAVGAGDFGYDLNIVENGLSGNSCDRLLSLLR